MSELNNSTFSFRKNNLEQMENTGVTLDPCICKIIRGPINFTILADGFIPETKIESFYEIKIDSVTHYVLSRFITI